MQDFIIIGHKAVTTGGFSLNDMPGSAGRMDILCRCINSVFFLSHDLRRDVQAHLLLLGEPNSPRVIRFNGEKLRYLNPDERSAGALIKKALELDNISSLETRSTPGVWVREADLSILLDEFIRDGRKIFYFREDGEDIRYMAEKIKDGVFILGDHLGLTEDEENLVLGMSAGTISVGPLSLHADHCIILINNELDRIMAGQIER
ncbi:tRNA (pseudouridine(54)-N(1))-methyltransferase TrmY [Methanomethylovorans sp.]|uniref:tRNA (pseudouridine(54)-N(1))-methyltransferase TrmY n=1 Tax=Methanomethylovorans sp. TaxID=2758717 RepID=UPI003D0D0360